MHKRNQNSIFFNTCTRACPPNSEVLVELLSLYLKPSKDLDSPNPTPCPFVLVKVLQRNRINIVVVESLSHVRLFATSCHAACQASLSFTISQSLLKVMSIDSVMPSNHLTICHPLLLLLSIFPSIRVFSNELALHIRWSKYWSFSFSISPSSEYAGLISSRVDWFDLFSVRRTLNRTNRRLIIIEIGSYGYEGPQPAVCKLENQESQWCNWVWVQELGHWWCKPQSESEILRTRSSNVQGQEKIDVPAQTKSKFTLPLPFCSVGFWWIGCCPTIWEC